LAKHILPYEDAPISKKEQVELMFDKIAHRYDFLNHFLSLGIDRGWRKKAIKLLASYEPKTVSDIATGTADLAIEAERQLTPERITGVDLSEEMLAIGKKKIEEKGLSSKIELHKGDSEQLSFSDNTFDAATVAFGVRNFEDLPKGLSEIARILKTGAPLVILEFSTPEKGLFKVLYDFYFDAILPTIGRLFSKENRAYSYLPESVRAFPDRQRFLEILSESNLDLILARPYTFGICTAYLCEKR
jgi:demethylmenaquinone methyltransferase/2-methoxy-6-polyprenyl-1,4-benzoquinol methylase